jgi:hypothetical protein
LEQRRSDLDSIGIRIIDSEVSAPITREKALEKAHQDGRGLIPATAQADAILARITDEQTGRSGGGVANRLIWLVRYTGFSVPMLGPIRDDGTPADGGFVSRGYVYIDGVTGEWLMTRLEGP